MQLHWNYAQFHKIIVYFILKKSELKLHLKLVILYGVEEQFSELDTIKTISSFFLPKILRESYDYKRSLQ